MKQNVDLPLKKLIHFKSSLQIYTLYTQIYRFSSVLAGIECTYLIAGIILLY